MFQPASILLIEDSPGDARLLREEFHQAKILNPMTVIDDGEKALEYLSEVRGRGLGNPKPDLVLLDLNLPKVSGFEILAMMRRRFDLRTVPVAILSSSDMENDIIRAYDLSACCYLQKPLSLEKLQSLINSIDDLHLAITRVDEIAPARAN